MVYFSSLFSADRSDIKLNMLHSHLLRRAALFVRNGDHQRAQCSRTTEDGPREDMAAIAGLWGFRRDDCHGLADVLDVGVDGKQHLFVIDGLEYHDVRFFRNSGSIESELHLDFAAGFFRCEGRFRRDRLPIYEEGLAGGLVHQLAKNGVFLAGDEVFIFDNIFDGDRAGCGGLFFPADGGRRVDLRRDDRHGLTDVLDVGMDGKLDPVAAQALKNNQIGFS